jgi:hypothetical protein
MTMLLTPQDSRQMLIERQQERLQKYEAYFEDPDEALSTMIDQHERIKTLEAALRYCRNEMSYRIHQIERGYLQPTVEHFMNGEMYRAVEMADKALKIESKESEGTNESRK